MKGRKRAMLLLLLFLLLVVLSCNNSGEKKIPDSADTITSTPDTGQHYYVIDSGLTTEPVITEKEIEQFKKVKNLLEFHTKDSMKTDSTYTATLSMGKNISPKEMEDKVSAIVEPGGKVQVRDTTQEISLRMAATLEDKASANNPNFLVELIGGENNIRTYDAKKNKIVWQWNVTPLKEGNHELILSISQLDSLNYEAGSPETRHHNIIIFSEKKKGGFGKGVARFFEKNWQWLIGAVCVPLLIVWLNTRQRGKEQEPVTGIPLSPANKNWKRKKRY
jgi:hypothetical protein